MLSVLCEDVLYFYSRYFLVLGTKFVFKLNSSHFNIRDCFICPCYSGRVRLNSNKKSV